MGNEESKQKSYNIRVATMDYMGDQCSPFEFYSEDYIIEEEKISKIFKTNFEEWKIKEAFLDNEKRIKKMDLLSKNRYSPLYDPFCGIISEKFIDKASFVRKWNSKMKKITGNTSKLIDIVSKEGTVKEIIECLKHEIESLEEIYDEEIFKEKLKSLVDNSKENKLSKEDVEEIHKQLYESWNKIKLSKEILMEFDFLVYLSILQYVFDLPTLYESERKDQTAGSIKKGISKLDKLINEKPCAKFVGFMTKFFQKPLLNEKKKIEKTLLFLKNSNLDVLFIQEATENFCDELEKSEKDYRFIKSKHSEDMLYNLIILKETTFKKSNIAKKSNLKLRQILEDNQIKEDERFMDVSAWGKYSIISVDNFVFISSKISKFSNDLSPSYVRREIEHDLKTISDKLPKKYFVFGGIMEHLAAQLTREIEEEFNFIWFLTKRKLKYISDEKLKTSNPKLILEKWEEEQKQWRKELEEDRKKSWKEMMSMPIVEKNKSEYQEWKNNLKYYWIIIILRPNYTNVVSKLPNSEKTEENHNGILKSYIKKMLNSESMEKIANKVKEIIKDKEMEKLEKKSIKLYLNKIEFLFDEIIDGKTINEFENPSEKRDMTKFENKDKTQEEALFSEWFYYNSEKKQLEKDFKNFFSASEKEELNKWLAVNTENKKISNLFFSEKEKILQSKWICENYKFSIFPNFENRQVTSRKKRTSIQFQTDKSDKEFLEMRHFIIYDKRLEFKGDKKYVEIPDGIYMLDDHVPEGLIQTKSIYNNDEREFKNDEKQNELNNLDLCPNESHPFDSYFVVKNLTVPARKEKKDEDNQRHPDFESNSSSEESETEEIE